MLKLLTLIFLLNHNLYATSASNRIWAAANTIKHINHSAKFQIFAEKRYNTDLGETAQSVFLLGPHYQMTKKHRIGFLYGSFHSPSTVEHRFIAEHFQNYGRRLGFGFVGRTRLEGRYLEDSSDDSTRLRYFISILEKSNRFYNLLIWTEPFLNLTKENWTGNRTIERVRSFIGIRINIDKTFLDLGYMNEHIPRSSGDRVEHIISLTYHI